ncbi:MAG: C40 family peptidase, partial [Muribaculaceae bacterium]|nr:C40 family peptidase [Muribaculaceae bacterium]
PARWESGWMMHPGELNYHDWAEVYFQGVGCVPVDCSFGRYENAADPRTRNFYSHGMDAYRLAANSGVCGPLVPEKRFVRSETVDQQAGELECSKGNIFYPGFRRRMRVESVEAVERPVDRAAAVVAAVKKQLAPDRRQVIADIDTRQNTDGVIELTGTTSEQAVSDAITDSLEAAGIIHINNIRVYPSTSWALPRITVASLRTGPRHAAEMATQALMGMPLRVLDHSGEWTLVQTPDGYIAWSPSSSLQELSDSAMKQWRTAQRLVVTAPYQVRAFNSPKATGLRDVVSDLVMGCIVEGSLAKKKNGRVQVELPDGRTGWVDASALTDINTWAAQNFDPDVVLDMAYSMEGTPYLWGGTSAKTLDCSGLAKTGYLANGIILRRDASQQALTGGRIEAADWRDCRAGDLLFFGNANTGKVTHVAIYDANGNYVHSSGRVKRNSVDPESPAYLTTPFLHAVRIHGYEGTDGITYAREHPWYFSK